MITLERLASLLPQFPRLTVGLVGDLFLDRYLEIPAGPCETSLETGLEAYQVTRVRNSPGALGTVMNNLAALGVGRMRPVSDADSTDPQTTAAEASAACALDAINSDEAVADPSP